MDLEYHKDIFRKYVSAIPNNIDFNRRYKTEDGKILIGTEQKTDSRVGLDIKPGLTVPRESFYPVFEENPDINIRVMDNRAHGDSGGSVDIDLSVNDALSSAREWKEELGLDSLILLGHSFGGMIGALACQDLLSPYDAFISFAAPVELKKAGGLIPTIFTNYLAWGYSCIRWAGNAHSRDQIVSHHRSLNLKKFLADPKLVALRLDDVPAFNETMANMPNLIDIIDEVNVKGLEIPPRFYYGGKDSRLGIKKKLNGEYAEFGEAAQDRGMHIEVIPNLSHRFNKRPEREFAFSYNNTDIYNRIKIVIDYFK